MINGSINILNFAVTAASYSRKGSFESGLMKLPSYSMVGEAPRKRPTPTQSRDLYRLLRTMKRSGATKVSSLARLSGGGVGTGSDEHTREPRLWTDDVIGAHQNHLPPAPPRRLQHHFELWPWRRQQLQLQLPAFLSRQEFEGVAAAAGAGAVAFLPRRTTRAQEEIDVET